jgi:hypothetical protein
MGGTGKRISDEETGRAGQGRAGQGMGFGVSGWFYQAEYGKHYRQRLGEGPD